METSKTAVGPTSALASFALETDASQLPNDLVVALKRHLLDQLGIQLACTPLPWIEIATKYVRAHGKSGPASLVGRNESFDAEYAAFVNATAGHGFELDDSAAGASVHPGCVSVPTVLAIGEEQDCTGLQALGALAVGFEAITRIGLAMGSSLVGDRGFHQSCVQGVFGAALCTGRLLGFSYEQFETALGIAGSHSSGTTQFDQGGGDVKRLHAGLGAMGGIRSARLAALGFTAPRAILEGKRGILQAFCQTYDADRIAHELGVTWEFAHRASLKVYPCSGTVGAQIDPAQEALARSGQSVREIEEIVVGLDRKTMSHGGSIGPFPHDMTSAQFSVEFAVALALVKGAADFDAYVQAGNDNFSDPDVLAVSQLVRLEFDPECEEAAAKHSLGKVTMRFRDGTVTQAKMLRKGFLTVPLTRAEVEEKFFSLATRMVSKSQAESILEAVNKIETLTSIRELTRHLTA